MVGAVFNIMTYLTTEDLEDIVPKNPAILKLVFLCYGLILLGWGAKFILYFGTKVN